MSRMIGRQVLTAVGLLVGLMVSYSGLLWVDRLAAQTLGLYQEIGIVLMGGAVGGFVGYALAPLVIHGTVAFTGWLEARVARIPVVDLLTASLGLLAGLAVGFLFSPSLAQIPLVGRFLPTLVSLAGGWAGLVIALKKKEELGGLLGWFTRRGGEHRPLRGGGIPKILDTSAIIDGRIADIVRTGFLEGPLVVPGFVLEELRHIADSADALKRNRGRRGLDVLSRIRKEAHVTVQVYDREVGGGPEVDTRLLRLATMLEGKVLTTDYNLNKVAELQGVPVLNINELANAVKPVVLPGEEMTVHVIKDGKEAGQGVGYLDDGTMIVVDGGKKYMGETIGVLVTSVLQTAAGRMIFARPRPGEGRYSQAQGSS